jgi:hypothetical protein
LVGQTIKILAAEKQKTQIMKLIINPSQLDLLTANFHIIEGKGLSPKNGTNLINESRLKEYLVSVWFQGMPAEIRIGAYTSSSALAIARLMFPKANVTGAVKPL